jgi:hypothetical protein
VRPTRARPLSSTARVEEEDGSGIFWIGNAPWFFHSSMRIGMKNYRKAKAKSVPQPGKKNSSRRRVELSTQQKLARTAMALVDSEERLRAILDTAVEGIIKSLLVSSATSPNANAWKKKSWKPATANNGASDRICTMVFASNWQASN